MQRQGHELVNRYDAAYEKGEGRDDVHDFLQGANQAIADMARKETDSVLDKVLYESSNEMRNRFNRSDA